MNNQDSTISSPSNHHLPLPSQNLSTTTDTSLSSPVVVPTPSVTSEPDEVTLQDDPKMEANQITENDLGAALNQRVDEKDAGVGDAKTDVAVVTKKVKADKKAGGAKKKKKKKAKRVAQASSDSDADSESSDSESDSESEDEKTKRKRKRKLAAKRAIEKKKKQKQKAKTKERTKKSKGKKQVVSSDSSSSDSLSSDSDTEAEAVVAKKKKVSKVKKSKKSKKNDTSSDESSLSSSSSSSSSESDSEGEKPKKKQTRKKRKAIKKAKKTEDTSSSSSSSSSSSESSSESEATPETTPEPALSATGLTDGVELADQVAQASRVLTELKIKQQQSQLGINTAAMIIKDKYANERKGSPKKNVNEFKRIDQVWDNKIRDYKLIESTAEQKDEFDCVFTVRRRFDWEGKHRETQVDVKSKLLRGALQEIFKDCKHVSLVEETPQIDPRTLYHYYKEICTYVKKTLKPKLKRAKRSKEKKQLTQQIAQCKLLIGYIDEDFSSVRKALKPMLKAGTITYDLVWALFKPNTIAYTPTYNNKDDPRCFKVDCCYEYESWLTGEKSWMVDGRYLEYDGKIFGLGDHAVEISSFKGHKKITSLATYPLAYHKTPESIRKQLIERGKRFVALQGMNYRFQHGIAYMKVKRSVIKFHIDGRVMVDPAIFRRINPNYPLSYIKHDEIDGMNEDDSDEENGCCGSDSEEDEDCDEEKTRNVMWKDRKGRKHLIEVPESCLPGGTGDNATQRLDAVAEGGTEMTKHVFTEEELLIASPVVLGFSFSEKLWLEISLAGIKEIEWNSEAFDSLVLPTQIKQNLKGLVSSHRFNAAKTIDDVIQGKGKGLNVVLHGPPGVGKTLTGESIAEYLKCPLYSVSAGELGTSSGALERDLKRIMDITHSWGAILLLDEADVFLEARQPRDMHRNGLVSVFLRLTEYYQGILFLTTNRVETFDEAFQSRIHMGIRYDNLTAKARKEIWKHHVGKVEKMAGEFKDDEHKVKPFKESDFDELSKKMMNGRQIKNAVKASQSIALSEKQVFSMAHIKRVLEAQELFEDDMRGGKGYRDAMRQYT